MADRPKIAAAVVDPALRNKEVLILGGGLAGLAGAVALADEGFRVTLVERKPFLGGRAASFPVPNADRLSACPPASSQDSSLVKDGDDAPMNGSLRQEEEIYIDNCQHVLLKCCTNLLDFYRRLAVEDGIAFFDHYVFLDEHGRRAELRGSKLPAPFHLLLSFLKFHPLRWRDKLCVAYGLFCMLRQQHQEELDDMTMLAWLRQHRQTPRSIEVFWRPILVSALNERVEAASARYGLKVFLNGLLAHPQAFHMGVPVVPLGELYTKPCLNFLTARGGQVRLRTSVARLEVKGSRVTGAFLNDGTRLTADYFLSSLPPDGLLKVLPKELVESSVYFEKLRCFESSPITSIYLWFDRPITDLDQAAVLGHEIQWIFKKGSRPEKTESAGAEYLALVVSASRQLLDAGKKEIIDLALQDLGSVLPSSRQARLLHSVVIKEPFATFSCQSGCDEYRLDQRSPWENFFVAGDWTRTGWPPTMEGAVRSSYRCAELILQAEGRAVSLIQPDLPVQGLARWLMRT